MRFILLLALSSILGLAQAQPSSDIFPDFTFNDLDGNTHHLQSYLDQGKTVVIDVFATWCGPCQNSVPGIESLYNSHGQAGDESLVMLSFERDPSTNNEEEFIEQYGLESPVITEATATIAESWNITYQPRYFVICPDGSFLSQLNSPIYADPQPLIDLAEECPSANSLSETSIDETFGLVSNLVFSELNYSCEVNTMDYEIFDVTGSSVLQGRLTQGVGSISMESLPQGIFLLRVIHGSSFHTYRIVKTS